MCACFWLGFLFLCELRSHTVWRSCFHSDAFAQKFGPEPIQVEGLDNVYCMEVEMKQDSESTAGGALASMFGDAAAGAGEEAGGLMKTIAGIASSVS